MEEVIQKARILLEALPYIRKFHGKIVVVKYGGAAMKKEELRQSFAKDVVLLQYVGVHPVIVHGGGPQITRLLERLGVRSRFIDGQRVTDRETMEVVEMVLAGTVNKEIVNLIHRYGGRAVGLSGKDGLLITAKKFVPRDMKGRPKPDIELGLVGEVERVNTDILRSLLEGGFIPVIAPVGVGAEGETYNINADLAAGRIASAMRAEKLILLTDVRGIMYGEELISTVDEKEALDLVQKGVISSGMLPKVQCGIEALNGGVEKVHIIDGRVEHALLLEMFTDKGVGTQIVKAGI